MTTGRQATWLFDGFNLLHSLRQSEQPEGPRLSWIDPVRLATSHLHVIGEACELAAVHYFSAVPHHLRATHPQALLDHQTHLRALTALRPKCQVHLGHFQPRRGLEGRAWQEKGTDMAIAAEAIRACQDNPAAALVIVSGDSDFAPLVALIKERWPKADLRFAFPAHRASRRLRELCPGSFCLGINAYASARLPVKIRLPSGKFIQCPDAWKSEGV